MTCYHGIKIADMLNLISSPHQQKRHSPIYFEDTDDHECDAL